MIKMEDYFNEEAAKHDDYFVQLMGMAEFYDEIELQLEKSPKKNNILVLGCGTGLEIERIKFRANVTAVDIAQKMLEELKKKHFHNELSLATICGSLLDLDFGNQEYDLVLSCYVMHHFNEEQKLNIYNKIYSCLTSEGTFINGDSMEKNYEDERMRFEQAEMIYREHDLPFASLHIDSPFCLEHEFDVLKRAGFSEINLEKEWTRSKLYRAIKNDKNI